MEPQDARKMAVAAQINKIEEERLTVKMVLSFKEGKLMAGSLTDQSFLP